ncbi:Forkhead box protein I1c [Cucumispora dikerogammari]|nr:Forkhead box protein I1c [Cucumispora dikerogammari]
MQFSESNNHEPNFGNRGSYFYNIPSTLELCIEDVIPNMKEYKNLPPEEVLKNISLDYLHTNMEKRILSYGQFKMELNRLAHEILKKKNQDYFSVNQKRGCDLVNIKSQSNIINQKANYTFDRNFETFIFPTENSFSAPVMLPSIYNPRKLKTYTQYIADALCSFPEKEATTQEIYHYFQENLQYLIQGKRNWKISVRVNLSKSDKFCILGFKNPKRWGFTESWKYKEV